MPKSLYIDANTGEIRTALNGAVAKRVKLFLRDLVPLEIAFHQNGAIITSAVLEGGAAELKVGIRAKPGQGNLLAQSLTYTFDVVGKLTLSLETSELIDYFDALSENIVEAEFSLEIEVTSADESKRVTYYQSACLIGRKVNMSDDATPSEASAAGATVHQAGVPVGGGRFLHNLPDGTVVYADASIDRPAHGYTKEAVASGDPVTLWRGPYLNGLSGLTPGVTYYLSAVTPGFYVAVPPSVGLVQRLGVADSASRLFVSLEPQIVAI